MGIDTVLLVFQFDWLAAWLCFLFLVQLLSSMAPVDGDTEDASRDTATVDLIVLANE